VARRAAGERAAAGGGAWAIWDVGLVELQCQ
jgi:hypothetical protein